jgi:lysophospholipase L1-like esterase
VSRIVGPLAPDGLYGLGGVSFHAPPGARSRFGTAKSGKFGRAVSRFVVLYLEQPSGGDFQVNIDGIEQALVSSAAPAVKSAAREFKTTDGEHELEIVTKKGDFRGFGVIMERDVPGVVLDAIGVQGARIRFLDKQDDEHWAEQLRLRGSDLLIYEFGANESSDGFAYPMDEYLRTMRDVLAQGKRALPGAGCLVIGALDRAQKSDAAFVSLPVIPALVKEQRRAAREVGCAFFDTYRAMGGAGSMASWVRRGLGQADLTHPSGAGSEVLGNWTYRALVSGFKEFARAHR